ncbi:hypothetical protein CEXT_618061 [Caerostris extrusa]|uniref:Uncharacterized protein n=1 Tax=Caerostris extrusa TaxID=172846 RepID=A0AAV4QSJ2_CAEEX|nr:hypothetical protein CEXT_618061 [Caerostris extrusa]
MTILFWYGAGAILHKKRFSNKVLRNSTKRIEFLYCAYSKVESPEIFSKLHGKWTRNLNHNPPFTKRYFPERGNADQEKVRRESTHRPQTRVHSPLSLEQPLLDLLLPPSSLTALLLNRHPRTIVWHDAKGAPPL